jgi:hypothetical protein
MFWYSTLLRSHFTNTLCNARPRLEIAHLLVTWRFSLIPLVLLVSLDLAHLLGR